MEYFRLACREGEEINASEIVTADDQLLRVGGAAGIDVASVSTFRPDAKSRETQRAGVAAPLQIPQLRRLRHLPAYFRIPFKKKKTKLLNFFKE